MTKPGLSTVCFGVLRALLRLCVLLMVMGAALGARLAWGPVQVPVPERALDALTAQMAPGFTIETSGAQIDLFGAGGLSGLTLRDVRVADGAGQTLAILPELGVSLAFFLPDETGRSVDIRGIRLKGAALEIVLGAGGGFDIALDGMNGGEAALAALGLGALPEIELFDAAITYRDPARGTEAVLHAKHARLGPEQTLWARASVEIPGRPAIPFDIEASRNADGSAQIGVSVEALHPPSLAALAPALSPLAGLDAVVGGGLGLTLAPDMSVSAVVASLDAPKGGAVALAGARHPFERGRVEIAYTPDSVHLNLRDVAILRDGVSFVADAELYRKGQGDWSIAAKAPSLTYDRAEARLTTGAISVAAQTDGQVVRIERAEVASPRLRLTADRRANLHAASLTFAAVAEGEAVAVSGLSLSDIAVRAGEASLRAAALRTDIAIGGEAVQLSGLSLETLSVEMPDVAATVASVEGRAVVTPETGQVAFDLEALQRVALDLPEGRSVSAPLISAKGRVDRARGHLVLTSLSSPSVVLDLPGLYKAPLTVAGLAMAARVAGEAVTLPRLSGRVEGVPVAARGAWNAGQRAVSLDISDVDFAALAPLWPHGLAPGGRRWVMRNVLEGRVKALSLAVEADALTLNAEFAGARARVIPDMPPVRGAAGRVTLAQNRLDVTLDEGSIAAPGHERATIADARFAIPDLAAPVPQAEAEISLTGPAVAILRYLDQEPLALVSHTGFDIGAAKGRVRGKAALTLPIQPQIALSDVKFRAEATVNDFSLREPYTKAHITGDTLRITVTPEGLRFRSDARINGLSARVTSEQRFAPPPPGKPAGRLTLRSYLTREDFALRAGVRVDEYFDGVAVLDAGVDLFPGGAIRFAGNADLTGAALHLAALGWEKAAGAPVTLDFKGFRNGDGAGEIERITAKGTGITVTGRAGFAPDGSLPRADFERVALDGLMDARIRYRRDGAEGAQRVEIAGEYLDLRGPFAKALEADKTPNPQSTPRTAQTLTDIVARVKTVRLREALDIAGLAGHMRLQGDRIARAQVEGRVNGTAPARLQVERVAEGMALRLTAPDAGAFLGAASVLEGAQGGQLLLDARMAEGPDEISGLVRADGIVIRDSQTMRRILSGGPGSSLARRMLSDGLVFTKVRLPFSGVGGRWSIADGVAWGDALGLTLDGTYDIARDTIDLAGTVSPAYAINGALGSVPLLGELLTGGEGEGVFGVTFRIGGTTARPAVRVNPLSAIAPGFLRKIVSGVMDDRRAGAVPR